MTVCTNGYRIYVDIRTEKKFRQLRLLKSTSFIYSVYSSSTRWGGGGDGVNGWMRGIVIFSQLQVSHENLKVIINPF